MGGARKNLVRRIAGRTAEGPIPYSEYIREALYAPEIGYYAVPRERVGRDGERDFYTAESLGATFADLVITAAADLLGESAAREARFVEIGAEPGQSLLDRASGNPPFAESRVIRRDDALEIPANRQAAVFANEWLDALPFHRLAFADGQWRERGVRADANGVLEETLLEDFTPEVARIADRLPREAPEGYALDLPLEAETALDAIARQQWRGLILLLDYGKTWTQLTREHPRGTARTYARHASGADLLDAPGERDITCDLCWDFLENVLEDRGFDPVRLESQEAFFVKRAGREAERLVRESAGGFSAERQTLMELIHPAHMGQRFQVLWGRR